MNNKGLLFFVVLLIAGFFGVVGSLYLDSVEAPVEVELTKPEIRDIVKKTVATGSITRGARWRSNPKSRALLKRYTLSRARFSKKVI